MPYYHRTPLWIRKRKNQFTKPAEKVEVPYVERNAGKWWYDDNYYCKKCESFYSKSILFENKYCGVCKDKRRRVRLQTRRCKSESMKKHYNEKYI